MILLFSNKNAKSSSKSLLTSNTNKTQNKSNSSVENSGILAMNYSQAKSLLTMGEFDTYVSSHPVDVNYALYANFTSDSSDGYVSEFMGNLSNAMAFLDGGCGSFDAGSFTGSCCGGGESSSFASFC